MHAFNATDHRILHCSRPLQTCTNHHVFMVKVKAKYAIPHEECWQGAHLPGGRLVRRQTYGYLPSHRASSPFGRYSFPIPLMAGGCVGLGGLVKIPGWYARQRRSTIRILTRPDIQQPRTMPPLCQAMPLRVHDWLYILQGHILTGH